MKYALTLTLFVVCFISLAQIPDGYYDNATGLSGEELKTALYDIIKGHTEFPYSSSTTDTWDILKESDRDPNNAQNVIGVYSGFSMDADAEYNDGDGWTREHVWAKSRGDFGTELGAGTDVHHLKPEDNSTNSARSNRSFAECNEAYVDASGTYQGATGSYFSSSDFVWEPRAAVKGDIARMIFYMATRYEGENGEPDLEIVEKLVDQYTNNPEHGRLTDLLIWHEEDPVDDFEKNRNDVIYSYQKNRNPYIDHPEYVAEIWGTVAGPIVTIDKATFVPDFGSVAFGESNTQAYYLNGYKLTGDVTVSVDAPFYLSLDNSSFGQSVTLTHESNKLTESFKIYLKFEPQQEDGADYTADVTHTTEGVSAVVLSVSGSEGEAQITSILEARAAGVGALVDITGVVIGGENNSSSSRVLYDGTAGIVIRSPDNEPNETADLVLGDSVVVSGVLTEYNNLLQVNGAPMSVTLINQNAQMPEALPLTTAEVGEAYESQLVIIEDVEFADAGSTFKGGGADGNFTISDATGTLTLRIGNSGHPLVGKTIPAGKWNVVGYVGQFGSDYQISPRSTDDIQSPAGSGGDGYISIQQARFGDEGDYVSVKGIVIGGPNNSQHNRVVYDGTAGIVVRSLDESNPSADLQIGDSVMVSGGLFDYNGLLEIEKEPVTIEVLNTGNVLPDYQVITISEINNSYESEPVLLQQVRFQQSGTFQSGDYTVTDGSDEVAFVVGQSSHDLVGMEIPATPVDVYAYVSEVNGKYEIYVNSKDDVKVNSTVLYSAEPRVNLVNPNPVKSNFNISMPQEQAVSSVLIYNLNGQVVYSKNTSEKQHNIKSLKSGTYIVVVRSEDDVYFQRIIKQ
ncbi:endonuclease [Marinoscillum furvescens]|uniref:Putative secreted protein (Por secretion system target) n=1 Tax=Marinoscillum furvescens DSM 4134 TaxID=1122208 RepID=A0A3D9L1A5_MARFU|nr:endonuclease [Marinoscillum furvescens]RED97522.1 putative secreted protein (Por secretion system target) [Marinoscillum furvescens DSM 4134]